MKSFAKINLGLNILNKRQDGYHNIETIFIPIDIFDTLEIFESESIEIESNIEWLSTKENNICYKVVKLLQEKFKIEKGVRIKLHKQIPIGAGLGGGSSDAATLLKMLNSYYNLNLSKNELKEIALTFGSDVPYFIETGIAYALGRGEELTYISTDFPFYIVIVFPNISVSTKWAYEMFIEKKESLKYEYNKLLIEAINNKSLFRKFFKNDFEDIVFKRYAGLISIKNVLYEKNAFYASLSGSGSSLFGLYESKNDALRAYDTFKSRFKVFISEPFFLTKSNRQE